MVQFQAVGRPIYSALLAPPLPHPTPDKLALWGEKSSWHTGEKRVKSGVQGLSSKGY